MNKEEFIKKLRKRLNVLEDSEVEDIINEYVGFIEEKVNAGKTEEEAIKELGDFEEIVSDLLSAYKVKEPSKDYGINSFFDKIVNSIEKFINLFETKNYSEICKILIEIIFIAILIAVLKIPFSLIEDLSNKLFFSFDNPFCYILGTIWNFIISLSYIIISVIIFIKVIEKRVFKNLSENIVNEMEEEDRKEQEEEEKRKELKKQKQKNKVNALKDEPVIKVKKEKPPKEIKEKTKNHSFLNTINYICICFLKIIDIMILIGTFFYLLATVIATGLMAYLLFTGVKYFGIFLLIVSLLLGGIFIFQTGIYFVLDKKMKASSIFIKLLVIIVITGLSLSLSAIEIAKTDINYNQDYPNMLTKKETIPMAENLVLLGYNDIIIDNSLNDTITIEYNYPNFLDDFNINIKSCGSNTYCLDYNITSFNLTKSVFTEIIANLKNKKIYLYENIINKKVYISAENYQKLMNNYHKEDDFKVFTKTYNVLSFNESNEYEYLYLTLREYMGEEVTTVKVNRALLPPELTMLENYEFTFLVDYDELSDDFDENTIEDIFDECNLISVRHTNKTGIDINQENVF